MHAIIAPAPPRPGSPLPRSYLDEAREGRAAVGTAEERLDQALAPRAPVVLLKQPVNERHVGTWRWSSVCNGSSNTHNHSDGFEAGASIGSETYAAKSRNCSVLWRRDAWAISLAERKRRSKASFDAVVNGVMHPLCGESE